MNTSTVSSFRYTLAIISVLYLVSACNPTTKEDSQNVAAWSITLEITGGFAGLNQTLTLNQTGRATLVDRRKKSRTEKQVSQQDLEIYSKLVEILPEYSQGKTLSDRCRDCINYSLSLTFNGELKHRAFNSLTLPDSDAKELLTRLMSLIKEMRASDTGLTH